MTLNMNLRSHPVGAGLIANVRGVTTNRCRIEAGLSTITAVAGSDDTESALTMGMTSLVTMTIHAGIAMTPGSAPTKAAIIARALGIAIVLRDPDFASATS